MGGGPFCLRPGQWTDDTATALALAGSLAAHPELDEHDPMDRFVDWHERGTTSCTGTCFDIGATTRAALSRWKKTGNPRGGLHLSPLGRQRLTHAARAHRGAALAEPRHLARRGRAPEGEDADTTAAITGQLAGGLHGTSGISEECQKKVA